jgi:hypothetical protein
MTERVRIEAESNAPKNELTFDFLLAPVRRLKSVNLRVHRNGSRESAVRQPCVEGHSA